MGKKLGRSILLTEHLFHACKVLLHAVGPTALLPLRRKACCGFITLKIHRPWPGLNPRTLGPVASTLTTRPPRVSRLIRTTKSLPTCLRVQYRIRDQATEQEYHRLNRDVMYEMCFLNWEVFRASSRL
jgi:hypothetical protein